MLIDRGKFQALLKLTSSRHISISEVSDKCLNSLYVEDEILSSKTNEKAFVAALFFLLVIIVSCLIIFATLARITVKLLNSYASAQLKISWASHFEIPLAVAAAILITSFAVVVLIKSSNLPSMISGTAYHSIPRLKTGIGTADYVIGALFIELFIFVVSIYPHLVRYNRIAALLGEMFIFILPILISLLLSLLIGYVGLSAASFNLVRNTPAARVQIVYELCELLDQLARHEDFATIINVEKEEICLKIARIARLISRVDRQNAQSNGSEIWTRAQMNLAAENFLSLRSWVCFPQETTYQDLQSELCSYANIFLSGRYHNLPRRPVEELAGMVKLPERSKTEQILGTIPLFIYILLPIAVYTLGKRTLPVPLLSTIEPLLSLIYIPWVILGLMLYMDKLTPDVRALVTDIVKAKLGKG